MGKTNSLFRVTSKTLEDVPNTVLDCPDGAKHRQELFNILQNGVGPHFSVHDLPSPLGYRTIVVLRHRLSSLPASMKPARSFWLYYCLVLLPVLPFPFSSFFLFLFSS